MRPKRKRSPTDNAQAAMEMAFLLPILMAMVSIFIGLMLLVEAQAELQSATQLAAESALQSQGNGLTATYTTQQPARQATWDTLRGSVQFTTRLWIAGIPGTPTGFPPAPDAFYDYYPNVNPGFWCTGSYVLGIPGPEGPGVETGSVECSAQTSIDFGQTPVGWILGPFHPTLFAKGQAAVPPTRQ